MRQFLAWTGGLAALRPRFAAALTALLLALTAAQAGAQRFEQGLLWRIEGQGAPASHLLGTIHVADPRVTKLPPPVARELKAARSFTVEVGLEPSNLTALASRMVFLDGRDLPGVAGAELFDKAAGIVAKLGVPEPVFRLFKPWAAALLLSMPRQDPTQVLDYVLARIATEQGKPVYELESVFEQVEAFEGMAEQDQIALFRHAVDNHERLPRAISRLVDAWLARDLAAMWRISREGDNEGEEARRLNDLFTRRVIDERNTRMAERMQARLQEGGAFVAVGALHLYGDRGVLSLLERRGWRVTRVY